MPYPTSPTSESGADPFWEASSTSTNAQPETAGQRPQPSFGTRHPHERLVEAYRDAHEKLGTAYNARPFPRARTDSPEVRAFLQKLTRANLSLRLLRALCKKDVKELVDRAIEKVDKAVRAPITKVAYEDPSDWLIESIEFLEEAARRDVQLILSDPYQ
jgi:hypothetical protein